MCPLSFDVLTLVGSPGSAQQSTLYYKGGVLFDYDLQFCEEKATKSTDYIPVLYDVRLTSTEEELSFNSSLSTAGGNLFARRHLLDQTTRKAKLVR